MLLRLALLFGLIAPLAVPLPASAQDFSALRAAETAHTRLLLWRGRIQPEQLSRQLEELETRGGWTLPLDAALSSTELDDRAAVLIFDVPVTRFQQELWPMLRRAGMTALLLVDPTHEDATKETLELLAEGGIQFGLRLPKRTTPELAMERLLAFKNLAGDAPIAFMMGDGVLTDRRLPLTLTGLPQITTDQGVAHQGTGMALPSFVVSHLPVTSNRFSAIINALPLPITDVTPRNREILAPQTNPPAFGFTVAEGLEAQLGQITCRASGGLQTTVERLSARRIEVRLNRAFSPGLHRIDCLLPGRGTRDDLRWRWHGVRFRVMR